MQKIRAVVAGVVIVAAAAGIAKYSASASRRMPPRMPVGMTNTVSNTTASPSTYQNSPVDTNAMPVQSTNTPSSIPTPTPTPVNQPSASGPQTYTAAEIATHNSASSCWTSINGSVYDVTNWIDQHPGGPQRILALCGTDGSDAFNNQHGGQARPEEELAMFKIGVLAN